MKRTTFIGAATAGIVALTTLPATAATRVDGSNWTQAGVTIARQGCFNPDTDPVTPPQLMFMHGDKLPLGDRVIGWRMDGTGYGIGPTAHVPHPATAGAATAEVKFPTGYGQGLAVVTLHPTGDTGHWAGSATLQTEQTKAWQQIKTAGLAYSWRHYTADGVVDATAGTTTLPIFASAHGGDGDGAEVGFVLGCDGSTFFLDALTVGLDADAHTYDFQGASTKTALATKGFRTIRYGESVHLKSQVQRRLGGATVSGRLTLSSKPDGEPGYRRIARKSLGSEGRAKFSVSPSHSTRMRVDYLGTTKVEGSRSRSVRILVSTEVRARLVDARIVKGHAFTIAGRTLPRKSHTKFRLQRYDGKDWSTVRVALTGKDGSFRVGTKIARLGKSYWRVVVAKAHGNEAGKSRWMKLVVVAPPPPPHDGGDPPPTDPPPTGPPPTDPPPPPPDGPQRP